ncbi:hypothetical protein C8J57DRAFT_1722578 [Mycena rebaudengoi]|nr:hypothetical protein C8J57DRAFT_1722578 [Mycena rebaudengoi]
MAEVVAGFAGAGTTLAAARAATSAGFTGRHESTHRSELAELDQDNFRENLNASQQSLNEYYRSPNAYKDEYWFRLPSKIKKRNVVRKMKRAARDANQGLRECVDNLSDCGPNSDASSIFAESGSPPGSALERERIGDWIQDLVSEEDIEERTQPLYRHRDQLQFFKDALFLPAAGVCGPFVPQLMYKPRTNSDRDRYYVEEIEMEAPIPFWMKNPSECGIPLSDALRSRVRRLLKRDETVFEGRGPSVTIRLEWPGYRQWSRQISTKDFRSPPGPITRAKLAKNVAKSTCHRVISPAAWHLPALRWPLARLASNYTPYDPLSETDRPTESVDVCIVGGGPAGLPRPALRRRLAAPHRRLVKRRRRRRTRAHRRRARASALDALLPDWRASSEHATGH